MVWKARLSREQKITRRCKKHLWFAWYPVKVGYTVEDGRRIKAWLIKVVRSSSDWYTGLIFTKYDWRYELYKIDNIVTPVL